MIQAAAPLNCGLAVSRGRWQVGGDRMMLSLSWYSDLPCPW